MFGEVEGTLATGTTAAKRGELLTRAVHGNERTPELANRRYQISSGALRTVREQEITLHQARRVALRMQSEQWRRVKPALGAGRQLRTCTGAGSEGRRGHFLLSGSDRRSA
ncbi:hypothetical protein ACCAA_560010 [Candidatus Accumulibacter aalborgensis]|uniref:Uncharacterized protein n=1 Tax=Candidatus Accumulibacter aalborgensis TaxID=1860102 RepID=A0A1A8XT98_9PROT|nr:hypothetical protein ACCAA_560010 [Candidatus Accumulibacter aalborgensis]